MIRRFLCSSFLWVLLAPFAVTFGGAASNQAVLIANHGQFPVLVNPTKLGRLIGSDSPASVTEERMLDDEHCVMTSKTHLNALADIFDSHDAVQSVGDFMLTLGGWLNTFCPFVWFALVFKKCWEADAV